MLTTRSNLKRSLRLARGPSLYKAGATHAHQDAASLHVSATAPVAALRTLHYRASPLMSTEGFSARDLATSVSGPSLTHASRKPHFDKILIANRGEIACRVIRTARKLGIRTVAVYSDVDADSMHVHMADEAYCIGPAPSAESYLRADKIIEVCKTSGAQAVHPGYGFLSENAQFAERLAEEGLVFIGPPASAIVSMGSKSESKNIMIAAGVPCVPGYHGSNQDPAHLASEAARIGYPVLIKAVHGGGGKGMRAVHAPSEFSDALASAQREAQKGFGNSTVLVEKFIQRPRHVEVQVFSDTRGGAVALWERDCSVQRRNQKIIEEAPAPGLSAELRADLCAKAVAAARAVDYVGAGTVEFIFDNDTQDFFFMEMNTRLQVEHPVTEMITGLDLVEWQLEVAAGNALPLTQSEIPLVGHAFEARIYAENPRNNFLPDSGTLVHMATPAATCTFAPPQAPRSFNAMNNGTDGAEFPRVMPTPGQDAPAVRLEAGFGRGSAIGVFYDPMIAKLVVHGRDRTEALRALRCALEEYHVVGLHTNVQFLRALAGNKAFIEGEVETGFIPKHFNELFPVVGKPSADILAQAALFVALRDMPVLNASASGLPASPWRTLGPRRFGGDRYERVLTFEADSAAEDAELAPLTVHLVQTSPGIFDVTVRASGGETAYAGVRASLSSPTELSATLAGRTLRTSIVPQGPSPSNAAATAERLHLFAGGSHTTLRVPAPRWLSELGNEVLAAAKGALRAPMPSLVVEVRVAVGEKVKEGQVVVVLESMKTETVLRAPKDGVVKAVGCAKGDMVAEGKELVDIEEDQ